MSELTPCNYCTLRDIRKRNADKDIELRVEDDWTACYVDGKRVVSFLELTDDCAC